MTKPDLWIPEGLSIETFTRVKTTDELRAKLKKEKPVTKRDAVTRRRKLDQLNEEEARLVSLINTSPVSDYPRESVERTVFVSVRPAIAHPGGWMVEDVYREAAEGRVRIFHERDEPPDKLHCSDYVVKTVSMYGNIDMLERSRQFYSAATQVFEIPPAKKQSDNLRPAELLLKHWWGESSVATWPKPEDLQSQAAPDWIIKHFHSHPHATGKGKLRETWLPGYQDIYRELEYDTRSTKLILNLARKLPGGGQLNDFEIVEAAKSELAISIFANAGKWLSNLNSQCAEPDWFGYVVRWAEGKVDRIAARLNAEKVTKDSDRPPWQLGKELLAALPPAKGRLDVRIANTSQPPDSLKSYYTTKGKYAIAKFYLAIQSARRFTSNINDREVISRSAMGLLRAIDRKVEGQPEEEDYAFAQLVQFEVQTHLQPDFEWKPVTDADKEILQRILLSIDPQSSDLVHPREVPIPEGFDSRTKEMGPAERAESQERLERMLSELPVDERNAIRIKLGSGENDFEWTDQEIEELSRRGIKRLRNNRAD